MTRGKAVVVVLAAVGMWLAAAGVSAAAETASVLLEKGIYTEETLGDPSAAIPIYKQVVAEAQADRQVVAQATFHLAVCHKKLKQDALARELLRQLVQQYADQEALVAKAMPLLEELAEFDPATLMPPDTLFYLELGSPGAQLEKVLKMLEGTPFANPLAVVTERQRVVVAEGAGVSQPAATVPSPSPGDMSAVPMPRDPGQQFLHALFNPSMMKEFKKIRGAAMGVSKIGEDGPEAGVAVLRPGESDALRGILQALLVSQGQPSPPIDGMQVVRFKDDAACAFDDEVFIIAAPPAQLDWSVRQYKGANQPSLAGDASFAALAPASSRRQDAVTAWASPGRLLEAIRPMLNQADLGDVMIIYALADIPNMKGAVGRLRLLDNGLTLEASAAYDPSHQSLIYDLIRTPPMSGTAFAAVPQQAAVLAGVALLPPGEGTEPNAPGNEPRAELVRHITGLDLGRELFSNIEEMVVFLDSPGEGLAAGSSSKEPEAILMRSVGLVIVSRDPGQTRAVLDRLLGLPGTLEGQTTPRLGQNRTAYPLVSEGEMKMGAYIGQEGHTTVLALDPKVRDQALEALRSGRNARSGGALAKALAESQGASKLAVVSVGGIFSLLDVVYPTPPTQPTTAPAAPSLWAQLAAACANTTARLETVEKDDMFTVRLTVSDLPPMKDVFPLAMQLQGAFGGRGVSVGTTGSQPPPQDRNKLLRRAAMDFVAALQKNDQAAISALVVPNSPIMGKAKNLTDTSGLTTFQFEEMRRMGDVGWVVVCVNPDNSKGTAMLIYLHKQPPGGPTTWLVTDADAMSLGEAMEKIRELAPNVVPVTRQSLSAGVAAGGDAQAQAVLAQLEAAGASEEVKAQAMAGLLAARAKVEAAQSAAAAAENVSPKLLHPISSQFIKALGQRDQAEIKALILPGSAAEKQIGEILSKADFATFTVREVRRNGDMGMAVVMDDPAPGKAPAGTLVIQLRMVEENVWRVIDLNYVALDQGWRTGVQPAPQPSTQPASAKPADVRITVAAASGMYDVHAKDAGLREILVHLSGASHRDMVASKEVTGPVSVDMSGMPLAEALKAILGSRGFVFREKNNVIEIYTARQLEEVLKSERTGSKVTVVAEPLVLPSVQTTTQPAPAPGAKPGPDSEAW